VAKARCIMVLGTASGVGKSWLVTALCRYYSNQGLKVAPFKAQNMSNNARVVALPGAGYGEIGSAQYFQALAARARPDVRMNPLLLKPEADTRSQVVLLGQVDEALSRLPWRERSRHVWPYITAALDSLRADNDVVVIEGAGSPAEINLHANDVVNMRVAHYAEARCWLLADIDRGGAFAHLYGTWALLPKEDRARIDGFVLNQFRGDAALLAPAPQCLHEKTGIPVVATIPRLAGHGLPEEDGIFDQCSPATGPIHTRIAIVALPRISNVDEFQPLQNIPGVALCWARTAVQVQGADWIIVPGSKATAADLTWLRERQLDAAICAHAARGRLVLGLCAGLQMLGEALIDTQYIDGNAVGLGLLPLVTCFAAEKTLRQSCARFAELSGAWQKLSAVHVQGYEIHHGQTAAHPALLAAGHVAHEVLPGLGWMNAAGNVLGLYLHGLFENDAVLHALFGVPAPVWDTVFERMAGGLEQWFEAGVLG